MKQACNMLKRLECFNAASDFQVLASAWAIECSFLFFNLQGGSAFWLDWRRGRKAECPTRGVGMLSHQLKPLIKRSHAAASYISARGESLHNAHRGPFASNIMRASSIQRHWRSFAWYLMNVFLIPHNLCDSLTGSQGGPFPNQILPGRGDSRSSHFKIHAFH